MNILKALMVIGGTISLAIGVIGIFIPGLPTTPFLLLTAALYIRSSDRLYEKLLKTRIIGEYIREYREAEGMTLKQKISSISLMWTMILASSFFFIGSKIIIILVIILGLIGTYVMGWIVPTVKKY
jgi:uncharacterized protein